MKGLKRLGCAAGAIVLAEVSAFIAAYDFMTVSSHNGWSAVVFFGYGAGNAFFCVWNCRLALVAAED